MRHPTQCVVGLLAAIIAIPGSGRAQNPAPACEPSISTTCCAPDCCAKSGGCVVGVEATYLTPNFGSNVAIFDQDFFPGGGAGFVRGSGSMEYDYDAAPRVWFGYENPNGLGIRARYWDYEITSERIRELTLDFGANTIDSINVSSQFEAYTIDLEVTGRLGDGAGSVLGSFGIRHAAASYQYGGSIERTTAAETQLNYLDLGRRFDGTGLTFSLEGRRAMGSGGFALFGNLRGSVLWGDNKASALSFEADVPPGLINPDQAFVQDSAEETGWIGETQIGVEWSKPCQCGLFFARVLFEVQWWSVTGDINGVSFAVDSLGNDDLFLYGLTASAGLSY